MYAQAAIKPNTLLRNGAYGIVMRGVQKCTLGCSSLRGRKRLPLCCIKLDTVTDPACGSGNFLTETYTCLRKLEDVLLGELQAGQTGFSFESEAMGQRVRLSQFYGIEINDFAVTVAETALWISRLKANGETSMLLSMGDDDFPLHEAAHIVHGNALRMDWNEVVPANQCSFILGNPPFYGARMQSKQQKAEIQDVFMTLECESISRMTLSVGVTRLQNKLTCT